MNEQNKGTIERAIASLKSRMCCDCNPDEVCCMPLTRQSVDELSEMLVAPVAEPVYDQSVVKRLATQMGWTPPGASPADLASVMAALVERGAMSEHMAKDAGVRKNIAHFVAVLTPILSSASPAALTVDGDAVFAAMYARDPYWDTQGRSSAAAVRLALECVRALLAAQPAAPARKVPATDENGHPMGNDPEYPKTPARADRQGGEFNEATKDQIAAVMLLAGNPKGLERADRQGVALSVTGDEVRAIVKSAHPGGSDHPSGPDYVMATVAHLNRRTSSSQGVALSDQQITTVWLNSGGSLSGNNYHAFARAILSRASSSRANTPDIKTMVDRFLGWKLPHDFSPDCGISFAPVRHYSGDPVSWPIGTSLFNADQARQMFEYVLAASPAADAPVATQVDTAPMYKALMESRLALLAANSGAALKAIALIDAVLNAKPASSSRAEVEIPEGYALVPKEPTPEMQRAAALAIRFETTLINKLWTGNAVYRAMLAAAEAPNAGEPK